MDPLVRFSQPESENILPARLKSSVLKRMKYVEKGIKRVQIAANLLYPKYYVEPVLPVTETIHEMGQLGVLYARTIPVVGPAGVEIVVQLSAALVAYAATSTINAVLAHEFLHYVEFVRKFTNMDSLAEEISTTIYESVYADAERLYDPKLLYKDKRLINLLEKKFAGGLNDPKLHEKTTKNWVGKGLPILRITPESNTMRIPVSAALKSNFDIMVKMRIEELDRMVIERAQRV
ncbi:MAG: hypothetical protein HYY67_02390 [Thaumarchaeota archaeon]|nr:hypothetical protein [Nitrososphaerota archaeon]